MAKKTKNLADYIVPLNMNGLRGRMLRLPPPAKKKREILLVYGHHASLERMFGVVENLNRYGGVTLPDLPGFGGMQSFYRINEKPSLDNLADYLATFIKLRYKRQRITIMAVSFGFVVATRMLQKYPELAKRVDLLVSVVGFVHKDDFKFKKSNFVLLKTFAKVFSFWLPSLCLKYVVLRGPFIRLAYWLVADNHSKLKDADAEERFKRINFEIVLWKINDIRTYMYTTFMMFKLNICDNRVELPVYHVAVDHDRYFDNHIVEQHLHVIYSKVTIAKSVSLAHAPTVVATAKEAQPFIPISVRRALSKPL